jgi:putative transposase
MTRKPATVAFWRGRLPHWEVEEGRYSVTLHLAGAIPKEGQARILSLADAGSTVAPKDAESWLRVQRSVFREMEAWLDRAEHRADLAIPDVARMVVEALEHRERRGDWRLFEYVVMPNHLHLFFELGRVGLKQALEDFKRWTGHQAARHLRCDAHRFWQREWFDHWSRSDEEDERIIRYIRVNPVKAGLVADCTAWPYGSWSSRSRLPDGTPSGRSRLPDGT